jgi:hypothetical protein
MDTRVTYGHAATRTLISLYFPPELDAPETIEMRNAATADVVEFVRLSDRSLECLDTAVRGHCPSPYECHRRELGVCQCGRHDPAPRPVRAEPLLSAATPIQRPGKPDKK